MSDALNRRDFLASTAGVAAAVALPFPLGAGVFPAPAVHILPPAKPVAIRDRKSVV